VGVSLSGKGVTNSDGDYEFLPASYASSKDSFPLLIFIHGIGELGNGTTDLPNVLKNGVPKLIANGTFPASFTVNGQTFSFIVVSPQFKNIPSPMDVLSLINYLKKKYRINNNRIYVTGLSMGGGATEDFASANDSYSQIPAAVVAVAGNMNPKTVPNAPNVIAKNDVPEWFLHNEDDPTVPSQYSKDWVSMINAYKPAANPQPKLTVFNASGHDAWTKAYDPTYKENGLNVYEWMLQFAKGQAVIPSNPNQTTPPVATNKRVIAKTNIGSGMYYLDAMTSFGLKPGDTLCISAGDYEFIQLGKLVGTAAKPIVITNCGGLVRIGINTLKSDVAFSTMGGQYIEISGSGTPGLEYGFDVNGKNNAGVRMTGMYLGQGASDFNVHHIYFHDASNFIVAKTTQECNNPQFWEGKFVMKNCKIHHIKGRYSQYEGFYIGNTHYIMDYTGCKGIKSHHIQDLEVYSNDIQHTGYDGIQIAMDDLGENKVHDNIVRYYGEQKLDAQSYGMLMGGGSRVKLYNNVIDNGYLPGIALFGSGISYVYNNTVSNVANGEGINVSDKLILQPVTAYIFNNTIYNTGPTGIKIYADLTTVGHKVYNNLVINAGSTGDYPMKGYYIRGNNTIKFDFSNNQFYTTPALAKVVDAASINFKLSGTSAAIDAGKAITDISLTFDAANLSRPVNGKIDVGAYEYQGTVTTPPVNKVPVANAGNAITITLPVNSVSLDGTASSDPDGTITAYAWKKVSGPTSGVITGSTANKTTVTGLTAGTYIFQLSVTDNSSATALDSVTVKVNPITAVPPPVNKAPVANAGNAVTITLPVSTITLDGTSSSDADGNITAYTWKKLSGPTNGVITSSSSSKTTVTGLIAGTYVFQLSVTDNNSATTVASVTIKVNPANVSINQPPVANAGNDINITLPVNTVTLNGSASKDPDGTIVKYLWEKMSGPDVRFSNAGGVINVVSGMAEGSYIFKLTVTDNNNTTAIDYVNVVVKKSATINVNPLANAGSNITITLPLNSVTLNGSGSKDSDGTIVSYLWQKISGKDVRFSDAGSVKSTVSALVEGSYIFQLIVTDNNGASSYSRINVTVLPALKAVPVALTQGNLSLTLPVSSISADGSKSYSENGEITTYSWKQLSGPTDIAISRPWEKSTSLGAFSVAGDYVFELTVTDNNNLSNSTSFNIKALNGKYGPEFVPEISIYPNPAVNVLHYKQKLANATGLYITISNAVGRVFKTYALPASDLLQQDLDVSSLPAGIYFLQAQYKNSTYKMSFKFIKAD
jgi:parallel beta-helix repeat protein